MRSGSRYHPPRSKAQIKDTSAQSHLEEVPEVRVKRPRKLRGEPNLLVTQAGRARKVPKEGLPPGFSRMTWAEKKKVLHLQDAAKLYKKIKIVKAIEKQVGEGGDRYETTAAVLNLAIVQYRNAGEEPPWDLMEEVRLAALVPSLLALQLSKHSPTLNSATKGHNNGLGILDFRPSVAAHTRPLQPTEIGVVEDILKARTHALEVIPIDESIKKTTAEILAQAIQNSTSAIGISSHRFQKELLGKRSRGQQKQKPIHAVDDPSSNVTVAPSLPSAGKRKYKRVKDLSTHTGDTPKQYLPSVAAHTWPDASNQSSLAIKKQSKPGKRKYKRVENFIECHGDLSTHTGNIPKQYLPSIAAHTWPVASNESTIAIKEQPKSGKRKYNRKKKSTAPIDLTSTSAMPGNLNRQLGSLATLIEGIADHYLPSVAAHTWPVTPYGLTTEALPAKRKLDSVEPTQRKRQKKASWKMTQLDLTPDANSPTRTPQARQRLETQTYEQQLKNIPRPISGCYVGKLVNLAQPGKRGPKRKSQLAVLKSPGIHWLACFSTEASMAGAATQVPYQQPAAENQRSSHEAIVTDAMNTDIPPAAGMPDEASSACVTQQGVSPPLPVSRTGTVRQSEGGGVLDQLDPIPQQQNNTAPTSPNITEITGLTMPEAPHPLEHSTGAKRKRSTNDEAGRDAAYPPPRLAAFDHAMASTSDSTRTATEPKEPTAEDGAAPSATDTPILSPGSYVLVPALAGEASEPHNEHTPPTQSPIDLNRSEPHAIQPESVQQQGDDDRTADTHAQPHLPLAAGNQFTESDPSSNGIIEIQEQQAPTPCIQRFQANINTTPSISIRIHRQNPPNDPFPADREAMHDVPEDASSVADVEAGDPVAPSNYRSVSPRPGPPEKEVEEGNDMMFGRSSLDQSVRDLHSAASEASLPQVLVDDSTEPKGKKGIQKMRPQGGSIAAQRRKIVMDIIERCGGIYPGVSELAVPFKEQWSNSGYPGTAERSTLKGVVDYLCGINKLRQLTFFFKDLRGLAVKKTMIIKFDINTTDPRISAMRQKIERKHPTWYFPDEVGISDEVRDTYWNPKGPMKNRTVKDLEVDEERVQLQQKPGYIERYEVKEKARQERMAHQEQQAAMMRALMAEGNLYDRSILGSLGTPHKRRRLLTTARKTGLTGPRPKVNRLTSLQKGPAASAGDHDEGTLPPADRDSFRKFSQATGQEGASQRLWEMHKMKSPQSRKSLTFTPVLGIENFESAFESQRLEEKRHVDAIERITAANAAEGMAYEPELPPSSSARPEIRTFQLSNKGLSSVPDTDPETPQTARGRKSLHPDRHSRAARQQMFTIMEPEHVFHPATGTFSINFSPYRTHNQSKRKNHWQRPPFKAFDDYIDDCQRYELRERGLKDANFRNWPFVNFTFPHRHETPVGPSVYFKRPRFSSQCLTDRTPDQQLLADLAAAESRTVPASNHVPAKRKRSIYDGPFKTRRLTAVEKLSQNSQQKSLGPVLEEPGFDQIYRSLPHLRRGQKLAPEFIQRMLTAVTVVRMLTGGIDSHIDWVLVTRAFQPEYDQAYVQGAWPKVLQQHRVQAEMVRTRFQQMFLDAYEKGLVPPLDYDNLEAYDWPWLIDWTIENLDTPIEAAPNLPLQRDELDQVFDFEVGEDRGMSTYYEFCTGSARVERREAELHKQAWVVPLSNKPKAEPIANGNDLELAKNWVRANVSTKEDVYRPRAAADKLLRFDAKTRDRALTQLQSEGVIMHRNKGRSMPGCQYDLTQKYLKPLKKKIETGHLRNAAMFKRQIDEALASEGEMIIPQVADDAFMLAVQNMQAHRKLSFVPKNPPMEKFGLGGVGNYRVRQIPKSKYHFDVGLQATDGYVKGNPLLPLPEPPSVSQSEAEKEKIPLWYNIHGDFDKDLWEEAVAAIMSILVIRPGASVDVVEPSVRPTLGLWEVQMLLDWMVEAGAARKMGNSYVTEEWWWLCLDSGRTFDEDKKYKAEKERMKEPEQLREEGKSKEEGLREGNGEQRGEVEDGEDREDVQMEDV